MARPWRSIRRAKIRGIYRHLLGQILCRNRGISRTTSNQNGRMRAHTTHYSRRQGRYSSRASYFRRALVSSRPEPGAAGARLRLFVSERNCWTGSQPGGGSVGPNQGIPLAIHSLRNDSWDLRASSYPNCVPQHSHMPNDASPKRSYAGFRSPSKPQTGHLFIVSALLRVEVVEVGRIPMSCWVRSIICFNMTLRGQHSKFVSGWIKSDYVSACSCSL